MHKLTSLSATMFISLLASACQTTITDIENSPYYTIPVGSTITLNREIVLPPDKVSVYLQDGELNYSGVDVYRPHCKFEVYDMKPVTQTIEPDSLTIYKSTYDAVDKGNSALRYAALRSYRLAGDGGPSYLTYTTYLYLKSDKQPNIYRLRCLHWEDPIDGVYLTVAQIRRAVGSIMTLHLNVPRSRPAQATQERF